ncbi:tubulin polyglutamylase TTLL13-like isoform X3 [Narcine bancroftii]|uniref:tubulin polyglutamylase TTLL13-like isoform X3 n=1 Tax=Narcine bancroftii TaxID=1343680 RepID=UPI0038310BBB
MNAPGSRSDSEEDSAEEEVGNKDVSASEESENEAKACPNKVNTLRRGMTTRGLLTCIQQQKELADEGGLHKQELIVPRRRSKEKIIKEELVKKKKKRRRSIGANLTNCKYESVHRATRRYGLKEVGEDEEWMLYWTDTSISHERVMEMKCFQKINHFPGMSEICRKDLLARNLNRMLKLFPKDYNLFPRTWCLPAEMKKPKTYICKPDCGSQGRGIFITRNLKEIKQGDRLICQQYISKPFLIDGFKFDLRVYVLVTSCDPFRIYVYHEGLARFATSKYNQPSSSNLGDICMHLTNYAINKHSKNFVRDGDGSSKRKLSSLNTWLAAHGHDVTKVWADIEDVIVKTLISAYPMLKHNYRTCFSSHFGGSACFEILGFDILMDHNLKPWLLEVNHSPSFATDSRLDREVKDNLLYDTICLINLGANDKQKVTEEERRRAQERLWQRHVTRELRREQYEHYQSAWLEQVQKYEKDHLGGFHLIYPLPDSEKYDDFFKQSGSLFQETVASRAREECARQQLEEIRQKNEPKELAKGKKVKEPKDVHLHGESGGEAPAVDSIARKHNRCLSFRKEFFQEAIDTMKPLDIIDEEELQRLDGLLQRKNLLRALGVVEQVYRVLKNSPGVSGSHQTVPSHAPNLNKPLIYPNPHRPNQLTEELEYIGSCTSMGKNSTTELGVLNSTVVNWSTTLPSPQGPPLTNGSQRGNPDLGNVHTLQSLHSRFPIRRGPTWVGVNQLPAPVEAIVMRTAGFLKLRLNMVSAYPRSMSAKLISENSLLQSKEPRGTAVVSGSGTGHSSAANAMRMNGSGSNLWNVNIHTINPSSERLTVVSARAPMNQRTQFTRRANLLSLFQTGVSSCRAEKKKLKAMKYRRILTEFGIRGAPPRTLTSEALEQIRFLKATFPEEWSVCQLAQGFSVSEDVIRRVLKSKFVPSPERRMKQDAKVAAATLTLSHRTKKPVKGLPSVSFPVKALDSSKLIMEKASLARLSPGRATLPDSRASEKEAGRTKPIQQRTCTDLTDQSVLKANRSQKAAHKERDEWRDPCDPSYLEQLPAGEMMDGELEKLAARAEEYQMKIIQRGQEFYDQDGSFLYRTVEHLNDP